MFCIGIPNKGSKLQPFHRYVMNRPVQIETSNLACSSADWYEWIHFNRTMFQHKKSTVAFSISSTYIFYRTSIIRKLNREVVQIFKIRNVPAITVPLFHFHLSVFGLWILKMKRISLFINLWRNLEWYDIYEGGSRCCNPDQFSTKKKFSFNIRWFVQTNTVKLHVYISSSKSHISTKMERIQ